MTQDDERIHEIFDEVQQRAHLPRMTVAIDVKTQLQTHNRPADFTLLKHVAAASIGRPVEVCYGFTFARSSEAETMC